MNVFIVKINNLKINVNLSYRYKKNNLRKLFVKFCPYVGSHLAAYTYGAYI